MVYTDPHRLSQILYNLTDNALKFTEEGVVTIGYHNQSKKGNILFFVKDTGIGISKSQQNIIFERFGKAEENKEKLFRGAGLGLSISKKIIELLGGRLWLESQVDKGSAFYFSIQTIADKN